ncbi:MAG: hypothetical protein LBN41_03795 [Enterobacteriaceae bacterium]|jgi:hypothetical protein|nr:hypothetical protein [Enterobacteriaceae bacterium]
MNNMKTTIIPALLTLFIAIALIFSGIYFFHINQQNNFTCAANVTYLFEANNPQEEALMTTKMRLHFENSKGVNLISGRLKQGDNSYVINRRIEFKYINKDNNYTLDTTNILLSKDDDLPKNLGERYLYRFSTERNESTHLTIIKLDSGKLLFTNGTLPYFLCE